MAKTQSDCGGMNPVVVKRNATAEKRFSQKQKEAAKKDTKKK